MPEMNVGGWWDRYKGLPEDLPDTAYDALREQFFNIEVRPELLRQGVNAAGERERFMQETARPDKSRMPRLNLAVTSAARALTAPVVGMSGPSMKARIDADVEKAKREAGRQGVGPLATTALETVGDIAGSAPYFIPALRGAKAISQATKAGKAIFESAKGAEAIARIPGIGITQGLYDAAKADEGHRLVEGMEGAAIGTALTGAGEVLLNSRAILRKMHNLTDSQADAVIASAKGAANDVEQNIAGMTLAAQPAVAETIPALVTKDIAAGRKMGIPRLPLEVNNSKNSISISLRDPGGKQIDFSDVNPEMLDKMLPTLKKNLDSGGEILSGRGHASLLNKLYMSLDPPVAERPGAMRVAGAPSPEVKPGLPGEKPTVFLGEDPSRRTIFHEYTHADILNTGIGDVLEHSVTKIPGADNLMQALPPRARLSKVKGQELVTYLGSAVRSNDGDWIRKFTEAAGGSIEDVMQVADDVAGQVKKLAMEAPDSFSQRRLIERMDAVQRRAGSIQNAARDVQRAGHSFDIRDGKFIVTENTTRTQRTFKTRDELNEWIEQNVRTPITAPNLIDETAVPPGRRHVLSEALLEEPLVTEPPMAVLQQESPRAGLQAISYFVRPFFPWLADASKRLNKPELFSSFREIDTAFIPHDTFVSKYQKVLYNVFKGVKDDRRHDLYRYFETPAAEKPAMASQLNLTKSELGSLDKLRSEFYEPLFREFNIPFDMYVEEYAPRLRAIAGDINAKVKPSGRLTQAQIDFFAKFHRVGNLDPRDTDLLRVSHAYLTRGANDKFLEPSFERARTLVDAGVGEGNARVFDLGTFQPILRRHLEFLQGRPDYTQKVVTGAIDHAIKSYNAALESANAKLPAALRSDLLRIDSTAEEALGRYLLFSYAGGIGLRVMPLVRDGLQLLTTTLPVLGSRWTAKGLTEVFGKQARSHWWDTAEKYGALISHSELSNLFAGGGEHIGTGPVTRAANWMLEKYGSVNNGNRLVSFAGHSLRAQDAFRQFARGAATDQKALVRASGMQYLDEPVRQSYLAELSTATPAQWEDIGHRVAKDLVDVTQWNYRRGANPGTYKTAIGRILGQYGTWPMNYVEYLRRIARSGDMQDRAATGARWAAAHYAILDTGRRWGVDTNSWVFMNPAQYSGGPVMTALMNAPLAIGSGPRADESRRQLERVATLGVPGGMELRSIYDAIVTDMPESERYKRILGFNPLKKSDAKKGYHILPDLP